MLTFEVTDLFPPSLPPAEKREALKAELERLKGEPAGQKKSSAESEPAASKGSITLQELRLPLKADFVCSTANRPGRTAAAESSSGSSSISDAVVCFPPRFNQTFVFYRNTCRSGEHGGHAAGQHSPWPQRRHADLPHQVQPVSPRRRAAPNGYAPALTASSLPVQVGRLQRLQDRPGRLLLGTPVGGSLFPW